MEVSKQNTAKWKIGILDKIEKKNHQNQSSYEGEIPVTSSKPGLKRKKWTIYYLLCMCTNHALPRGPAITPGAAGPLIGVEYSRVRDSTWNMLYLFVTTRTVVGLARVHGNYSTLLE